MVSIQDCHLDTQTRARWTKPDGRELALDGIATSAPYNYSALDPKPMEERGIEQFRRKLIPFSLKGSILAPLRHGNSTQNGRII